MPMAPIQNKQSNRSAVQNVSHNIAQSIPVQFNSLIEATKKYYAKYCKS